MTITCIDEYTVFSSPTQRRIYTGEDMNPNSVPSNTGYGMAGACEPKPFFTIELHINGGGSSTKNTYIREVAGFREAALMLERLLDRYIHIPPGSTSESTSPDITDEPWSNWTITVISPTGEQLYQDAAEF